MRTEKESKQKRGMRLFLILPLAIFFISLVSAVTCSPSTLSTSFQQGNNSSLITLCSNPSNSSVSVSSSGSYFSLDTSTLGAFANNTIRATFDPNSPVGTHSGSINFGDSSTPIPVLFVVTAPPTQQPSGCSINIFPTTLANIKIAQADNPSTRNVQISVPLCFSSPVTVQGISLQTNQKPVQLGELSLGNIQPGQSMTIPITIDASNVAVGQYSDTLQFLLYNSTGNNIYVPNTDISVLVTSSISPIDNFTQAQLPSCSITSVDIGVNGTSTFVCSLPNPNFDIETIIDNNYLSGVSTQKTSTQYIYTFKGKNIGTSEFVAKFKVQGSQIGDDFNKSIRVSNSGSATSGTNLDFSFYQEGKPTTISSLGIGETVVLVVDNSTRSLVDNPTLYLNGLWVNNTFNLSLDGSYELRATSPGYVDRIINLSVSKVYIDFNLIPLKSVYVVGDTVNFNTSLSNISYFMDDIPIGSAYTFTRAGEYDLRAEKDGYLSTKKNLTVQSAVQISISTPHPVGEWSKGDDTKLVLTDSGVWNVTYEPFSADGKSYLTPIAVNSGIGNQVQFKINDSGKYNIYVDGVLIQSQVVNGFDLGKWMGDNLGWTIGGGAFIFLGLVILIIRIKNSKGETEESSSDPSYGTPSPFESEQH